MRVVGVLTGGGSSGTTGCSPRGRRCSPSQVSGDRSPTSASARMSFFFFYQDPTFLFWRWRRRNGEKRRFSEQMMRWKRPPRLLRRVFAGGEGGGNGRWSWGEFVETLWRKMFGQSGQALSSWTRLKKSYICLVFLFERLNGEKIIRKRQTLSFRVQWLIVRLI